VVRKSVWILNHYAVTPDMDGGTRHFDLGKQLVRRGYEVVVFASGFDHRSKRYIKVGPKERLKVEELEGVRFAWLNTSPYYANDWRRVVNMVSYAVRVLGIARRFRMPDVVIGSSVHPFAALAGWWLASRYKARFIFEVRDLWPQTAVDMGVMKATAIPARLLYAWEKFMYQRAEKVIVLMPKASQYIESRGIDPGKVVWIPNGVDLERYRNPAPLDPSTEAARALDQHKDKFKVVYAGAHGPANGLGVVIETAALMADRAPTVHFLLIGDGPEKQALRDKAKQLGCTNITFAGPLPKTSIPAALQQADLLLQCIRPLEVLKYGVSPNKVNDYLASGRPIVMSVAAADDVVTQAQAGLTVPPGDAEGLAGGILQLLQMSKEERERLGANGRAYAEKHRAMTALGDILTGIL